LDYEKIENRNLEGRTMNLLGRELKDNRPTKKKEEHFNSSIIQTRIKSVYNLNVKLLELQFNF